MSVRRALLALVLLAVLAGEVDAQIYRWTDDDGNVHYADSPGAIPERFRQGTNRVGPDQLPPVPIEPAPAPAPRSAPAPHVPAALPPPVALPPAPMAGARRDVVLSTATALYAVTTHIEAYEVGGRTAAEIRNAISRQRPGAHDGRTTSAYRWRYRTTTVGWMCAVAYVELEMTVSIIVPAWSPPRDALPGLAELWSRYHAALRVHEEGHRQLAVNEGHEVLQSISRVRGACGQMDAAIRTAAGAVSARYRRDHVHYDAQTRHGATQGAVFP